MISQNVNCNVAELVLEVAFRCMKGNFWLFLINLNKTMCKLVYFLYWLQCCKHLKQNGTVRFIKLLFYLCLLTIDFEQKRKNV